MIDHPLDPSPDVIDPVADTDALHALAHLHDQRRWADVVALTDAWLDARGTMPATACHFRAAGLQGIGQYPEAMTWAALAAQATTLTPATVPAFIATRVGMGQVLARLGKPDEALPFFRAALKPTATDPHTIVAQGHLRLAITDTRSQWRKGWAQHEARIGTDRSPRIPGATEWDGGPTPGPVVVLHEQGIGDAVLFARYLPWVASRSGHPVLWAGPAFLHRWIAALPGVVRCLNVDDALLEPVPGGDVTLAHGASAIVRAMSLPHHHGTGPDTMPPPAAPFGLVDPGMNPRTWNHTLPIRVGLCWAGAQAGHHDYERSIPPETFALLWADPLPGVEYVSLQYATPVPDGAPFDAMPEGDVMASAERIASCDLVVSVDTSIVHLAGSLGVPTIALVPTVPDWRYVPYPRGTETPWYSSVVVVRRESAERTEDHVLTARELVIGMVEAMRA